MDALINYFWTGFGFTVGCGFGLLALMIFTTVCFPTKKKPTPPPPPIKPGT